MSKDALKEYLKNPKSKDQKTPTEAASDFLAIVLQKIESHIFIDIILNRLYSEGYSVLSKHDSILVKESQSEQVKAIMNDELISLLGRNKFLFKSNKIPVLSI